MAPEVICAGPALIDCIFKGFTPGAPMAEDISVAPGGEAFNEAVNIARLGHKSALLTALGKDIAGDLLLDVAAKSGVDVGRVVQSDGIKTPVSGLFVDDRGERASAAAALCIGSVGATAGIKSRAAVDAFLAANR